MRFGLQVAHCLLPGIMLCNSCHAADPAPTIGFYKLDDERLTGETTVIAKDAGMGDLILLVTVDITGKVIAAKPLDNFEKLDPAPALALVRHWTFRPPTFEGNPVNAVGMVSVTYQKQASPADASIAFPDTGHSDATIRLERGACYGSCPDYRVTVHSDGLVEFDTDDDHFRGTAAQVHLEYNGHNVLLPGHHTAHVDPATVAGLLERFRAAHFFGLKKEYFFGASDNPIQVLTVRVGNASKTVTDYIGTMAGMPQDVRDLEDAVDTVAGTARWVNGNAQTLDDLDAARFDYRSHSAAMLAAAAAIKLNGYPPSKTTETLILGLVERGVPLETKIGADHLGARLVQAAAMYGSEALFDKLSERGALTTMSRASLVRALNGVGCSPKIARELVKAGADPHAAGEHGTSLTSLRSDERACGGSSDKQIEMARTLIELGVPLEARDDLGWTALMGCNSPELARLLLAHGANPNVRDEEGTTPLLSTNDDRVALILLRAGADPRARDREGSVRTHSIQGHMPATLAWLDAHGIR